VTCLAPEASRARNMIDLLGGARGCLPDAAQRRRMVEFIEALPPAS